VDHYSGFGSIVGSLRNPRVEGDQAKADLHLIESHPMFSVIMDLAEDQPGTFGLSIAFSGSVEEVGKLGYARVVELYSVDLVDSPAANPAGLFQVTITPNERKIMTIVEIKTAVLEALGVKRKVEEVETQAHEFEEDNKKLTAELATSLEKVITLEAAVAERDQMVKSLEAKLTEATKNFEAATNELKTAKAAVTEFDAKVAKAASAKALEITQSQGQAPVKQDPVNDPAGNSSDDLSHLKGREKVKAAFERQLGIKR